MRIALVSDLHGNAVAFDAVLRDLEHEQVDELVCLGDVAQGGPQPAEVVDRLRQLGCRCVYGNSDHFVLTLDFGSEADQTDEHVLAVGEWSQRQLGAERLEFLQRFEPTVELDLGGRVLVCCHATPTSNEHVILPDVSRDDLAVALGDADIVACGHVHLQWHRRVGQRIWFSVGSVGLVWEHVEPMPEQPFEPWAEYGVLTSSYGGELRLEFRRVPFDVEAVLAACRGSGMPDPERYAAQWQRA